jgi:hypothetical protein
VIGHVVRVQADHLGVFGSPRQGNVDSNRQAQWSVGKQSVNGSAGQAFESTHGGSMDRRVKISMHRVRERRGGSGIAEMPEPLCGRTAVSNVLIASQHSEQWRHSSGASLVRERPAARSAHIGVAIVDQREKPRDGSSVTDVQERQDRGDLPLDDGGIQPPERVICGGRPVADQRESGFAAEFVNRS